MNKIRDWQMSVCRHALVKRREVWGGASSNNGARCTQGLLHVSLVGGGLAAAHKPCHEGQQLLAELTAHEWASQIGAAKLGSAAHEARTRSDQPSASCRASVGSCVTVLCTTRGTSISPCKGAGGCAGAAGGWKVQKITVGGRWRSDRRLKCIPPAAQRPARQGAKP